MLAPFVIFAFLLQASGEIADTSIVATVGRFTITKRDLMESYEFGPAFVKTNPKPLRKHLEYMIYERLIALDVERQHLDTAAFVRDRVAALEEDLAVDQLYKDQILSEVRLTPAEIELGVNKARINVRLQWIYAENKSEAEQISRGLKHGISFDTLYSRQSKSLENHSERALETTLLRLTRDNPDFARKVAHLRSQEISEPIAGPDGYYIVHVDQIWQNPLLTQTENDKLRDVTVKILQASKADSLAQAYVRTKMMAANPLIKAEGYDIVRAYFAEKGLSQETRLQWNIDTTFMTEAGPQPIKASGKFLDRPLVTFNEHVLTVRDYLQWFDIRQFELKTRSLAAFNSSVERTIWKMIQDRLLSEEAYARRLNLRDTVQHEKSKWEAKLLYLAGKSHFLRSITIPDSSVRSRYEMEKHRYKDSSGKLLSFAEVKERLRKELDSEQQTKVLFRVIQRFKKESPVHVNEALVQQLSSLIEREKTPINVIFYKSGGTFPRVAFPTIDAEWEAFE